jgi:hypothetical protein
MNPQDNKINLAKFGALGAGQIIFGVITIVVQRSVSNWLATKDIEQWKPNPIRGFQATPMQ